MACEGTGAGRRSLGLERFAVLCGDSLPPNLPRLALFKAGAEKTDTTDLRMEILPGNEDTMPVQHRRAEREDSSVYSHSRHLVEVQK